jgi:glutamate/tyrosine decarboxylase-like PLP-dependent enzyme
MDLKALSAAIAKDRSLGLTPFMIIGTAGTVDVGAIDDLNGLADIAAAEGVSFHVDGALGALAVLSPELAARVAGIERCDSLAFDFHKWGHVPYDAGYLLVRDAELHHATFANPAVYLARAERGIAAGDWWPCDYGSDLSRGFRALKTWFTLQTYGLAALGDSMAANCALARVLAARVESEPELELLAPVALNIVCFRYRRGVSDALTAQIVSDLQEAGEVAPSLTIVNGQQAIRAAIVNHRTRPEDIELLVDSVIESGRRALQSLAAEPAR